MIIVLIILCSIVGTIQAPFKTLDCTAADKSYGEFTHCEIKIVGRNKKIVNIEYLLRKSITDAEVQVKFFKRANGWHPYLYNIKFNLCKFMDKPYNPIARLGYSYVKEYTNVNRTCPYKPNEVLRLWNFDFDLKLFRNRLPIENGLYAVHISGYQFKNQVFGINLSVEAFNYKEI